MLFSAYGTNLIIFPSQQIDTMNDQGPGYCHNIDFKWPIGGNTGYDGDAIYMDSSGITAIAATHHNNDTVIFLGDSNGHLKKGNFFEFRK